MNRTIVRWLGQSLVLAAGSFAAACTDRTPLAPTVTAADARSDTRVPDTGTCGIVNAPVGSKLVWHAFAQGVQIYRWSGTSWVFVAPSATLTADEGAHGQVGTHYAGPTWETNGGSKVVGSVQQRCTPNANSIPWLLLGAVSSEGPGVLHDVTHIQRLNTVGGNAPAAAGTVMGETTNVPYTAEYFFYRTK